MPVKDMIGQKFNHLTVLERAENDKNGNARWLCECDCKDHTQRIVLGTSLRSGNTKSCGCIKRQPWNGSTQDLTNQRFGQLVALEPTDQRTKTGAIIWKCQCDCGNIVYTSTVELNRGHKLSCGCILSQGEEKIAQILLQANINFMRQYSPVDCINPKTNRRLKFDFAIIENEQVKYLIEYDGQQHYEDTNFTSDSFADRQYRDELKNQWCRCHSIPLVRIPYWEYDNLTLDLILKGMIKNE